MDWEKIYREKLVTGKEAASRIKSGDMVFTSSGPSAPFEVLKAVADRYEELEDVTIAAVLYMVPMPTLDARFKGHIKNHSVFVGPLERMYMSHGNIEVTSCNLSLSRDLFSRKLKGNVALLEVTPPDAKGYMNFGASGSSANSALLETAELVIVQVNRNVPYVYGTRAQIHVSDVDFIVEHDDPVPALPDIPIGDAEKKIAEYIVERVPDGAVIQIGFGEIANAVGYFLDGKKDLGAHTEMLTDSIMNLAKKGVITGARKKFRPGKITFGFGVGSRDLYEFMDRNPILESMPMDDINDINNIAMNDDFISINNALTVDLTGQVGAETIGHNIYSCTGGQLDFVLGAARSRGGKSFIALTSSTNGGGEPHSRIVSSFKPGTVVTTPRSVVQYIVTEYGVADLWLKSVPERVRAMIDISHPDFREELSREAYEAGLLN